MGNSSEFLTASTEAKIIEGVPEPAAEYLREAENEFLKLLSIGHEIPQKLQTDIEALRKKIKDKITKSTYRFSTGTFVSWRDLGRLEELIVHALPDDDMPTKLSHVVRRYERVLGQSLVKQYEAMAGKAWPPTDPANQRLHSTQMLREIYRVHNANHSREVALTDLSLWMSGCIAICVTLCLAFIVYFLICPPTPSVGETRTPDEPLFLAIFVCGMVGSFISVLRRLQDQRTDPLTGPDAVYVLAGLRSGRTTVLVGLFSGGVFAVVWYLILMSGLAGAGGGLLPKLTCDEMAVKTFIGFLSSTGPCKSTDYAMVLVWSVVAGFGERLVPDVLNRLQAQASKVSQK